MKINVIGGGLAGSEAAYFLASHGLPVTLIERKPKVMDSAFRSADYAELVCSNSLKSEAKDSASGLLKAEMGRLGSLVLEAAYKTRVPSGQDLSVDRTLFSSYITSKLKSQPNIAFVSSDVSEIRKDTDTIDIVCTGPLTSASLCDYFSGLFSCGLLSFYDAAAPLVYFSGLDTSAMYFKSRYDKGEGRYLNIPLTKEEYEAFSIGLSKAQRVQLHDFEHFEGCLPIEVMARRGLDTLRFGPLKPKGLETETIKPYAVVQLRQDDAAGDLYGFVGFQTNLTFKEQKRLLSSLPGCHNIKFARFGLMHRNSYINAPALLERDLSLKADRNIFIAGQFSGVEGYVESAGTGLLAAYYVLQRLHGKPFIQIPLPTMLGSLVNYLIMSSPRHFAPMNACYGILQRIRPMSKEEIYKESLDELDLWVKANI